MALSSAYVGFPPLHGDPRFQAALDRIELTLAPEREDFAQEGF